MRTIIAGGNKIDDEALVYRVIEESGFDITEVISGGDLGVDLIGEKWAMQHGKKVKLYPIDNKNMHAGNAEKCQQADALILVWDGRTGGSAKLRKEAKKAGLKIHEHRVKRETVETA